MPVKFFTGFFERKKASPLPSNSVSFSSEILKIGEISHYHTNVTLPQGVKTITRLFLGYYCGAEDYYTKIVQGNMAGWKYTQKFQGVDFHDNDEPVYNTSDIYSASLYEKRASQLVASHNSEEVS